MRQEKDENQGQPMGPKHEAREIKADILFSLQTCAAMQHGGYPFAEAAAEIERLRREIADLGSRRGSPTPGEMVEIAFNRIHCPTCDRIFHLSVKTDSR